MSKEEIHNPYEIAQQMRETKVCPYSKFIGYVNKFTSALGPRAHKIQSYGYHNIADILNGNNSDENQSEEDSMSMKKKAKIGKYAYDVELLEKEVYNIIQNILGSGKKREGLSDLGAKYNLRDHDNRQKWGNTLIQIRQTIITNEMRERENKKSYSLDFQRIQYFALTHSMLSRGSEQTFGDIFTQGVGDGFVNIWSIVYNLPEIFEAKYKRLPNTQEYASLVRHNIKSMIKSLASLHLESLVHVVRPKDSVVDITILANNSLEMNKSDFVLDDKDYIQVNNSYLIKKEERLLDMYREYETAYAMMPDYPMNEFSIRTGCPALRAKIDENKFVIDQFCDDVLELLDKIYFAHWDKNI